MYESQRPAKSYTALQTVRHRFNIYAGSCVALAPQTRYTLRRNTASIMKSLVWFSKRYGSTFDRKRIYANLSSYPNPNSNPKPNSNLNPNPSPNPKAQ